MLKTLILGKEVWFNKNGIPYTKDRKVYNKIIDKFFHKVKTDEGIYAFLNTSLKEHIVQLCFYVDKDFKLYTTDDELLKYRRTLIKKHKECD